MDTKEFNICVPWGHIATKTYGDEGNPAVIMLHGLMDNAGSFDTLLPLLPKSLFYISIDLPGHGKSSPFPAYTFITDMNNIFALKLVTDSLRLQKYVLMGHCRGGGYLMFFAQLYPHLVDKIVVLDMIYTQLEETQFFIKNTVRDIDNLSKINTIKQNPTEYNYKDAVRHIITRNVYGTLTQPSAEILLKRELIETANKKYTLSVDPRLGTIRKLGYDQDFAHKLLVRHPIAHACLFVISSTSVNYFKKSEVLMDAIKKHFKQVNFVVVTGGHYVHLNNPEVVAPIVTKFLINSNNKL